jgi:transposase
MIDPPLARKLARAADKVQASTAARDQLIREAVAAGGSYREVAELVGVSHTSVANIVKSRP